MTNGLLTANEVCVLLDVSIYTLNKWYEYKRKHPNSEYAQMLPDIQYITDGNTARKPRYWNHEDIYKLITFKQNVKRGCKGFMGAVTHQYDKPKEDR